MADINSKQRDSRGCFIKGHKCVAGSEKGWFKKGQVSWNADKTRKDDDRIAQPWLGRKRPNLKNTEAHKTMFKKGLIPWSKGKTAKTDVRIAKHSSLMKGTKRLGLKYTKAGKTMFRKEDIRITGENNPFWKGGITPINHKIRVSSEYQLWRVAVFTRDDYTCQMCGKRGGKLCAHHTKSFSEYPELRFAIDNGETLCLECHKQTENYGRKGWNRKFIFKEMN